MQVYVGVALVWTVDVDVHVCYVLFIHSRLSVANMQKL